MAGAYQTPPNEQSFSGLIDQVILETGKTAGLRAAVSYANSSIRECQALGLFARDLVEDLVPVTVSPFIWYRPRFFRSIRAAKFMSSGEYALLKQPGRIQQNETYYFYVVDNYFVFNGGIINEDLGLAVYYWSNPLIYFGLLGQSTAAYPFGPYGIRQAYYDVTALQWMYLNSANDGYVTTINDDAVELLRRKISSHWLLDEWYDLILEGTKAKLLKHYGDERAGLSFALYKSQQKLLQNTAGFDAEVTAIVGE